MARIISINEIEELLDVSSVVSILEALADACFLKAAHTQEAWQDDALTRDWNSTGTKVGALVDTIRRKIPGVPMISEL